MEKNKDSTAQIKQSATKHTYNGKSYVIRTGSRGGKYILVNKTKIYIGKQSGGAPKRRRSDEMGSSPKDSLNEIKAQRQYYGWSKLHEAIQYDNLAEVKNILNSHVDVNVRDAEGWTPLTLAVDDNKFNITKALLQHRGIDVNMPGPLGWTPLHDAVYNGNIDMIKLLLQQNGININQALPASGSTPLHLAVTHHFNRPDIIKLLLKHNANVNIVDKNKNTPIDRAHLLDPQYINKNEILSLFEKKSDEMQIDG